MTTGYILQDHPNPTTAQGTYPRRGVRGKLTGTAILHTSEGNWRNGVAALTRLVQTRADHGCYHVAVDWEDLARYYHWEWETWQDTETNNWAVGIAAACKTTDWATMPAEIREGYYRNLGIAAADFVKYMAKTYNITVPLARISGAQARAGVPGFCAHGDSGVHRSDPGADFDWPKFFKYTKAALDGNTTKEDTLSAAEVAKINAHTTAEVNRAIEYFGALTVSGYTVGRGENAQKFPGTSKVDIVNQQLLKTIIGLLEKPDLSADQITEAVRAGLEGNVKLSVEGVDVNLNITGKENPNG